jgi:hypothetical protein
MLCNLEKNLEHLLCQRYINSTPNKCFNIFHLLVGENFLVKDALCLMVCMVLRHISCKCFIK